MLPHEPASFWRDSRRDSTTIFLRECRCGGNNLSSNVRPGEGLTSFDIDNTGEKSTLKLSGVSML